MKFIKEHKNLFIAIIIFFLVLLLAFLSRKLLNNTENKAIYGDRLKEVKVKVDEKDLESKINDAIKEKADNVSVRVQGRIVNITIDVNKELNQDQAKEVGDAALKTIKENVLKVYDIQIFLNKDKDDKFPIIGYKNHSSGAISWTKNR